MRLKSFTGASLSAAMEEVRTALGDDAIIVATRDTEDGGVRITAAIDEDARPPAPQNNGHALTFEKPQSEGLGGDPIDILFRALADRGVPANIADPILERVEGTGLSDPRAALVDALGHRFGFSPLGDGHWDRAVQLVGPPGSGKTQTAAKLAARGLLSRRSVGLFSTDVDRAGGSARLNAFARALHLTLLEADDPDTLADGLEMEADKDVRIIDTAGSNHLNPQEMAALARTVARRPIEPVLVLPAGLDADESADIARAYREVGVTRLIATRLDMSRRFGCVLAAADAGGLTLAELSATATIKDGLTPATPQAFANLFVPQPSSGTSRRRIA